MMMTRRAARRVLVALAATALMPGLFFARQVMFRSGVDLVAVDTQVIDRDGQPIANLTTANFEVWINGQSRKVVSADLIQYPTIASRSLLLSSVETPGVITRSDLPELTGRVIVLAVDEVSFSTSAMPLAVQAAKRFVSSLPAEDVVALYSYPFGAGRLDLVHFHNQVNVALNRLQGFKQSSGGDLQLSPSEAIDITANDASALNTVYARECLVQVGSSCVDRGAVMSGAAADIRTGLATAGSANSACLANIKSQARDYATYIEQLSSESFVGLQNLLQQLSGIAGPKIVMLLSAGILSSDRVGGRPDATGMTTHAGQLAAAANVSLYAMHLDGSLLEMGSAVGRQQSFSPCQGGMSGSSLSNSRDGDLAAYGLQRIASAAGGQYFRVTAGSGDTFFKRVLTETSAYYVLGVQPEPVDRDGRVHFIRVKTVDVKNPTLHFRTQVTIPKQ